METLSDRQDACVKSTVENLHREILPLLGTPEHGQFLKDMIQDELFRHEALFSHERVGPLRVVAVALVSLVAGFCIGSL